MSMQHAWALQCACHWRKQALKKRLLINGAQLNNSRDKEKLQTCLGIKQGPIKPTMYTIEEGAENKAHGNLKFTLTDKPQTRLSWEPFSLAHF